MKLTLEEIRSITNHDEKIKKLKEFEEELRKELREAEELVGAEVRDIERERKLEGMIIPESEAVNLDIHFGETIEEKAEGPMPVAVVDSTGVEYRVSKDYETLRSLSSYEHLDEHQKETVMKIEGTVQAFKYLNTSKEVDAKLTASQNLIDSIKKYVLG